MNETEPTAYNAEVRELPEGWRSIPLSDLVTVTKSTGVPSGDPIYPFIGMEHIESMTGSILGHGDPSEYGSSSFIVDSGQVLYGRLRPYLNKVFIPTERSFASREFIPIQVGPEVSERFLLHRLRASDFVEFAISLNTGDRPRVKWPQMSSFRLLTPPLAEQERIVEILEEQLSRLDAALESVRVVREKAAQFRRSLLHAAFTGTLTGHNPKDGQLPEGWKSESLGHLTASTRPICYGVLKPGDRVDGGVPLIRIVDIKNDHLDLSDAHRISNELDNEFSRSRLSGGEVLLSIQGTIGRVALVPESAAGANISRTIAVIQTDDRTRSPFVRYWLMWASATNQFKIGGTTRNSLNIGDIRALQCPLPPLAEQEQIVEILEEQLSRLDAALAVADAIEKRSSALRRSLLHAAFTGRLTEQWRESVHV